MITSITSRFCLIGWLLLLAAICVVFARQAPAPHAAPNRTIRVDVDLVTVPVVVTDQEGRILTGLQQNNFQVFEDKIRQTIKYFSADDVPASVGVVFDVSGSMKDKRVLSGICG